MKRNFSIYIRIWFRKWKKNLWEKFDQPDKLSDEQKTALSIFITGLNDDNNVRILSINKGVNKKFIVGKDYFSTGNSETFITLETNTVDGDGVCSIINHEYLYPFSFPKKTTSKMNYMFMKAVIRDREKMENIIAGNIKHSLKTILMDFQRRQQLSVKMSDNKIDDDE